MSAGQSFHSALFSCSDSTQLAASPDGWGRERVFVMVKNLDAGVASCHFPVLRT